MALDVNNFGLVSVSIFYIFLHLNNGSYTHAFQGWLVGIGFRFVRSFARDIHLGLLSRVTCMCVTW